MYQDKSGMSFLDYNSAWGFIGNLFFALTKVKAYFGLESEAKGWFCGMGSRIMMILFTQRTAFWKATLACGASSLRFL